MASTILGPLYQGLDFKTVAILISAAFLLVHLVPWLVDPHGIRKYPGPFFAKFTDVWLGWVCKNGHRSEVVHSMHQKYGESQTI